MDLKATTTTTTTNHQPEPSLENINFYPHISGLFMMVGTDLAGLQRYSEYFTIFCILLSAQESFAELLSNCVEGLVIIEVN